MARILVLGGTGALGTYLVQALLDRGYLVDVVSLDDAISTNPHLQYIKADAKNINLLTDILARGYDGIVDFLIYHTSEFQARCKMLLAMTGHYIFLSTYRVYAGSRGALTESSPRMLEVATDSEYLAHVEDEYSLYKAREEDLLRGSGFTNWTILRPSITYSKRRFQLVTLEANILIHRMRHGKTVILPEEAMDKQTTLTWAGDFARMVAPLLLNNRARGETYTIATSEHHTWREIAEMYSLIGGLKYITVDAETFLNLWSPDNIFARSQLYYDRLFQRTIGNTKILAASGLTQADLMSLREGLAMELSALPADAGYGTSASNEGMDAYLRLIG